MVATIKPRVLFVDDEPQVLESIADNMRRGFDVLTATSGAAGLELLRTQQDIAVVVSDMRMPQMNGATFLTHVRETSPQCVRLLLTGQTDLASAVAAVNQGQIFRFLTKPCGRDDLRAALDTAVEQHRLMRAERDLLEQTVRGSIKMLVDILAITAPHAFGRANRIKTRVLELATQLAITETWQLEIAALSSQLGYIVLSHELCEKLASGRPLDDAERAQVAKAPQMAAQLLANIPRLEQVRDILLHFTAPPPRRADATGQARLAGIGVHVLKLAVDLDELEITTATQDPLPKTPGAYDREIYEAYLAVRANRMDTQQTREVAVSALGAGMVLAEDIRLANGTLLVARGYEVTRSFIERVANFPLGTLRGPVRVRG
jgi:ActR/RegA family two-component response regulator